MKLLRFVGVVLLWAVLYAIASEWLLPRLGDTPGLPDLLHVATGIALAVVSVRVFFPRRKTTPATP